MTAWEKSTLLIYLAEEKLYQWLAFLLCDKDAPLTLNSIAFILEISKRLTLASPKAIRISVIVAAIYRKKSFSRFQIAEFLSEVRNYKIVKIGKIEKFRRPFQAGFQFIGPLKLKSRLKNAQIGQNKKFLCHGAASRQKGPPG